MKMFNRFIGFFSQMNDFVLNNQMLFVIALVIFLMTWYKADVANNYIQIVAAIAGIIVVQSVLYHREVAGKKMAIVSKIGRSSLAIYALNNFFLPDLGGGQFVCRERSDFGNYSNRCCNDCCHCLLYSSRNSLS